MRTILITLLFTIFSFDVSAQNFAMPHWAAVIDSPNLNYYTVVQEFDSFWKDKIIPKNESELFENAPTEQSEIITPPKVNMTDAEKEALLYKAFLDFQYKRFKDWQQATLPYVQPDGSILTEEEKEKMFNHKK